MRLKSELQERWGTEEWRIRTEWGREDEKEEEEEGPTPFTCSTEEAYEGRNLTTYILQPSHASYPTIGERMRKRRRRKRKRRKRKRSLHLSLAPLRKLWGEESTTCILYLTHASYNLAMHPTLRLHPGTYMHPSLYPTLRSRRRRRRRALM